MSFLYPTFLWGLLAISIPILIHFLELRRFRKQPFPDNYFLQEFLKKKRRQQKIKQWILLALRILFIVFLTLTFAHPVKQKNFSLQGSNKAILYIDNSLSMQSFFQKLSLFDQAKRLASQLIDQLPPQTTWQIITNDGDYSTWLLSDEARDRIKNISFSPFSLTYDDVFKRVEENITHTNSDQTLFFVLSDFQKSQGKLKRLSNLRASTYLLPLLTRERSNLSVDSVWLLTPVSQNSTQVSLMVRVLNYSQESVDKLPVSLYIHGNLISSEIVSLPAWGKAEVTFTISIPARPVVDGYVEIEDPLVPFDNRYYFAFGKSNLIHVVHIAGKNSTKVISAIFDNDSLFDFHTFSPSQVDYRLISRAKLIVVEELDQLPAGLADELKKFVEAGNMLAMIPPSNQELLKATYDPLCKILGIPTPARLDTNSTRVVDIQVNHFLFKGVFATMPEKQSTIKVKRHYILNTVDGQAVLSMANEQPFLLDFMRGKGHVFVLSVPLHENFSNLSYQALVVPMFMQMAFKTEAIPAVGYSLDYSGGIPLPISYIQAEKPPYLKIKNQIVYPGFSYGNPLYIFLQKAITQPDMAEVWYANKLVTVFGLNYSRKESDPRCYTLSELDSLTHENPRVKVIKQSDQVKPAMLKKYIQPESNFWKWMLAIAILCLIAELLILRFWK